MPASTPEYYAVATGPAAETVKGHNGSADIMMWAGWFCPFSQRAWVALEEKGLPYQYIEVNPYLKEDTFLAISPKGLTPGLKVHGRPLHDSTVINEFFEEAFPDHGPRLLPESAYEKAQARLAVDFINKSVVPAFFRLLQAQPEDSKKQAVAREELNGYLAKISQQCRGKYFFGDDISLVDIAIAPWAIRDFIIRDFRGFRRGDAQGWKEWAEALESRPSVRKTTSVEALGSSKLVRGDADFKPGTFEIYRVQRNFPPERDSQFGW